MPHSPRYPIPCPPRKRPRAPLSHTCCDNGLCRCPWLGRLWGAGGGKGAGLPSAMGLSGASCCPAGEGSLVRGELGPAHKASGLCDWGIQINRESFSEALTPAAPHRQV